MNTIEKFNEHVMATYGRYPLVMESGSDECAIDEDGKKYILRQLQRLESAANGISSQNEPLAEEYKKLIAQIRKETGL